MERALIVNADDFGQSRGINRGITEAVERGIVTSVSLMVRWEAADEAAAFASLHPNVSVGLHVDLGEWVVRDGAWASLHEGADRRDAVAVESEVRSQVERFRVLLGRDPTHLDSHQHVHRAEPVRSIVEAVVTELGVPLRHSSTQIRYNGKFYGQTRNGDAVPNAISTERLVELLRMLPEGVTELACHPGYADDLATMYQTERELEIRALCDPIVRRVLQEEQILLCSLARSKSHV